MEKKGRAAMTGYGIIANNIFYPLRQRIESERSKSVTVEDGCAEEVVADIPRAIRRERPRYTAVNDVAGLRIATARRAKRPS